MLSFKEALSQVDKYLSLQKFVVEPNGLYEPIEYVLSIGGKRIRPCLTLMAYSIFSNRYKEVYSAALGLEVFHNFTLLHDDVMDNADVRRGVPTVHKKWDVNAAILSGDAMLIKAYQYMANVPQERIKAVFELFSKTAIEVCEGQQYDMEFEQRTDVRIDEYLEMIRLKTAVLLACSLKLGAIVAGATSEDASQLYDFGLNLGLAFQLKDDWLDIYGDFEVFGKAIGNDIVCNKKTYLLISAIERATGHVAEELMYCLNNKNVSNDEKIERVKAVYEQLGVRELSEQKMNTYYSRALEALEMVAVGTDKKAELKLLASKLMSREK